MRCQKVHSYLPAYSKGELTGREVLAVREHLATCGSCRSEEVALRALTSSARELPKTALTADFNSRLLNRIAQERFAETRTKAFFPRTAPTIMWRRVVPVIASATVLAVVAIGLLAPKQETAISFSSVVSKQLDNSYLTVQPSHNPNMDGRLGETWSLISQLAQHERLNRLSGMLTNSSGFSNEFSRSNFDWNSPYLQYGTSDMMRVQPVYRVFQPANTTLVTEERAIY